MQKSANRREVIKLNYYQIAGYENQMILPTFYDTQHNLNVEIMQVCKDTAMEILPQRVGRSVRLADNPVGSQPVATYALEHTEPYRQLAEVIDHD